jgi:hypothetical protein
MRTPCASPRAAREREPLRSGPAALLVVLAGAVGLLGCSGDESSDRAENEPTTTTTGRRQTTTTSTTALNQPPAPTAPEDDGDSGTLDRAAACEQFYDLVASSTMSDTDSNAALEALAGRTSDPELAGALLRITDAFATSDPEIYAEVDALCKESLGGA